MPMPRKRFLQDPEQYYVYIWRLEKEILWVGCGKNNRGRPDCKASWGGRPKALLLILENHRHLIEVEVNPVLSKEEALELEKELIDRLKPIHNTCPSHGGYKGMHSKEGLKKIGEACSNRPVSEETRQERHKRMLGNKIRLGKLHTEETKQKISKAGKGRIPSDLCRSKASKRMSERNRTNPPRKGKVFSLEHRRKLSEAARRRKR